MKVCSICQRCYDDTVASCAESEHPDLTEVREGSLRAISGYSLEMMLESGIKAQTYRARRIDTDQPCLIKILAGNDETKNQFLQDAKTAATIFNESIVDVYETGSLENGEVFVVAEEPAGQTARELLVNVGVPQLLTTVQVVRQAAEAVHALHLSGLTHRAIRPENIILAADAEHRLLVRIQNCDLGGVAEHSIVSNKFLIDSALDSLRYFAPEQFTGEGASVKSDVYSLGIVLYEMLAGSPPFDAEKASGLIDMHRNQRPPDVTINNFDLRMLITHSLMESLQKEPAKRQSSANAFARQLRHIEQLATHSPTPPPASVAPAIPTRASVATNAAAAAVKAAPIVEKPKPAGMADKTPTVRQVLKAESEFVALEPKPVPVAAPELETAPPPLVLGKTEAIPDLDIEISSGLVDEVLEITTEQPIEAATKPGPEPAPRSRLKRLKKQLRSFTTSVVVAQPTETSPSDVEVEEEELNVAPANVSPKEMESEPPENNDPPKVDPSLPERTAQLQTPER
jgi:serine/threonine protein kinase